MIRPLTKDKRHSIDGMPLVFQLAIITSKFMSLIVIHVRAN